MKGSCCIFLKPFLTSPPLSSLRHHRPSKSYFTSFHHFNFIASSCWRCCCSSPISTISSSPISHKPQAPLFLRPPVYSTTLQDLRNFVNWAKTLANSVGSTFAHVDNGPDSALLLREFNWFLDDTVEDPLVVSHLGTSENGELSSQNVVLRASLDQMYKLWQQRIEERRPFQYVVGCEHWRDLVLCVEEGVLIPRPETEKIVDLVGDAVGEFRGLKDGIWADLGTGSGALAIAVSRILGDNARVVATDLSPVAVAVASYNVERYALQDIIKVKQGSWFEPLVGYEGQLAGIVSNPPYIPSDDINGLQAEVGKHEPILALDGGVEGLDDLLHLVSRMSEMLKPGGFFVFETNGEKQCKTLSDYLKDSTGDSYFDVTIISDFAGIPRFVTGHRT